MSIPPDPPPPPKTGVPTDPATPPTELPPITHEPLTQVDLYDESWRKAPPPPMTPPPEGDTPGPTE